MVSLTMVSPAQGQVDPVAEARDHFTRGSGFLEQERFAEALDEFLAAYRSHANYKVLYNIGHAYVRLGRSVEAIATFRRYLDEGGSDLPEMYRVDVQADIEKEMTRVAEITLVVIPDGSTVFVDGREQGPSPRSAPLRVDAGEHTITASREGYITNHVSVKVEGQERVALDLVLTPVSLPPSAPAPATAETRAAGPAGLGPRPSRQDEPSATPYRQWALAAGAVGVAGVAVGAVAGAVVLDKKATIDAQCVDVNCSPEGLHAADAAQVAGLVSSIGFGVGAAGLVAGGILLLISPRTTSRDGHTALAVSARPQLGGAQVGLRGSW